MTNCTPGSSPLLAVTAPVSVTAPYRKPCTVGCGEPRINHSVCRGARCLINLVVAACVTVSATAASAQHTSHRSGDRFHVCTARAHTQRHSGSPPLKAYLVAGTNNSGSEGERLLWENGSMLTVKFLDGNALWRQRVQQYAQEWSQYANIGFQFEPDDFQENAHIRVAFGSGGIYSMVGKEALSVADQNQPTMNFEWHPDTSEEQCRADVLHEFGHALGFVHEHQSPDAGIPWDEEKVYAYYAMLGWDRDKVKINVLSRVTTASTNHTKFDRHSIMLYPIPNELTLGNFEVRWNTELSDQDKSFAAQQYPREGRGGGIGTGQTGTGTWGTGQTGNGQTGQGQFRQQPQKVTQHIDNPPIEAANIEFENTHSEELVVQLIDKRHPDERPIELTIPPGQSTQLSVDRDAGAEEVRLLLDPYSGETIQELSRRKLPPKPLYDVVVHENKVTYRVIQKTLRGRKTPAVTHSSLRSIGVFALPGGERISDGSVVDVYRDATHKQNPGAAARFPRPSGSQ